jgi:hypothetical protein
MTPPLGLSARRPAVRRGKEAPSLEVASGPLRYRGFLAARAGHRAAVGVAAATIWVRRSGETRLRKWRSMSRLSAKARAQLSNSAFAYVNSKGQRRLPIHDEAHVRNALARFNQISFEDDAARERRRLCRDRGPVRLTPDSRLLRPASRSVQACLKARVRRDTENMPVGPSRRG